MAHTTLPERLFRLHDPAGVDRFLDRFDWAAVFKAGSGDKTVQGWLVAQRALEPRVDVPVGFIVLPDDRAASDRVAVRAAVTHRSPQVILFHAGEPLVHLNEFDITPDRLGPALEKHLPAEIGPRVVNEAVVTVAPYRALVAAFVGGELPEERFTWAYLERLAREAGWRDEPSFSLLNDLFENPDGRNVRPARLIAREFQGRLAGEQESLESRARRQLERIDQYERTQAGGR